MSPIRSCELVLAVLLVVLLPALALAQSPQARRSYQTAHCGAQPPSLDGRLDEPCWDLVEWSGDFVQWQPSEGQPPSQQTQFKVIYDDDALYFGIRAFDTEPHRIVDHLARRDWFPGDWVEVNIGSHGDGRTAFSFTASVSGTRGDEYISEDGDRWDGSWDPVWELRTHVDELGWTAEVRIPFSQLRFAQHDAHVWGLQVQRRVFREEERSLWAPKRSDESGWVSLFGELHGIEGIAAPRRIEFLPYTVGKLDRYPSIDGDPFNDGSDASLALGLDGKMGLTGDLTLDFTVNPDFGQVEADPSQVNLSAFETFFQERRPFFVEGRNIFDFPVAPAVTGGSFTNDLLFYSRRIGAPPHASPQLQAGDHADALEQTSILGALKLSGKTRRGLSVGILESVTAEEKVAVESAGQRSDQVVEPLTSTFVGRVQQDFNRGGSQLGMVGTAVHRRTGGTGIDFLHRQAYAGGIDFRHSWNERRWYVEGNALASRVQGSPEAIALTQRSSRRYYQRPDHATAEFDPDRTSLSGLASTVRIGRGGSEGVRFQTGVASRSPGFEINDAGFQRSADEVNQFGWLSYRRARPFAGFRSAQINFNQWNDWDHGGEHLRTQFNANGNVQLRSNWSLGGGVNRVLDQISNTHLRGGPSAKLPGNRSAQLWVNSDQRRNVQVNFGGYAQKVDDGGGDHREAWGDVVWRPSNALRLSFSPVWSRSQPDMQFVATRSFDGEARYLFGSLQQETVIVTVRLDYTLSPDLTLQYYASPFLSSGRYEDFRRITAPRADHYQDRFARLEGAIRLEDGSYAVDEDGDGTDDYAFGRPDFDVRDFNSNLVLRWEYAAGSTLFVVWSHQRFGTDQRGELSLGRDFDALLHDEAQNVFLVKFSKWLSM